VYFQICGTLCNLFNAQIYLAGARELMQYEKKDLPALIWGIRCFDRKRKEFFDRSYLLDWNQLSPDEVREVLSATNLTINDHDQFPSSKSDETVIKSHFVHKQTGVSILKYRHYFVEIEDDSPEIFNEGNFCIHTENNYFEDEEENQITLYEIAQFKSKTKHPIIIGDPNSVLKLGATVPKNPDQWDLKKANTISQYLDIVSLIGGSEWIKITPSLSFKAKNSDSRELLESQSSDHYALMSVIAFFRQLYASGDKLFSNAVDVYLDHCNDIGKALWINERKQTFCDLVDSKPVSLPPLPNTEKTRKEIIEIFMYGAGLLHSNSIHEIKGEYLAEFIEAHGKHESAVILNYCLLELWNVVVLSYYVIKQDFEYWIEECEMASPTRFQISELFADYHKKE
jgi:hypothetical protein